ncbi:hypothetical protein [Pseudoclavibacter sp. JSM 162008]|uniref:hypothetical protein n=1 Tax=Pseudoclavibacter sp. JSM 162008 TaxID=3229855 RepID=UPI0035235B69
MLVRNTVEHDRATAVPVPSGGAGATDESAEAEREAAPWHALEHVPSRAGPQAQVRAAHARLVRDEARDDRRLP